MLKKEVAKGRAGRVIVMDSITKVAPEDAGSVVVCASHGGTSSGEFALEVPLKAVIFNDAGVGKDNAGIAALDMLQARGISAATVAHTTGRIGDSLDLWENGVLSRERRRPRSGLAPGPRCRRSSWCRAETEH
jgi:hypothetical protein